MRREREREVSRDFGDKCIRGSCFEHDFIWFNVLESAKKDHSALITAERCPSCGPNVNFQSLSALIVREQKRSPVFSWCTVLKFSVPGLFLGTPQNNEHCRRRKRVSAAQRSVRNEIYVNEFHDFDWNSKRSTGKGRASQCRQFGRPARKGVGEGVENKI